MPEGCGLAPKIAAARGKDTGPFGEIDHSHWPTRSNSNCLSGELVCELVVAICLPIPYLSLQIFARMTGNPSVAMPPNVSENPRAHGATVGSCFTQGVSKPVLRFAEPLLAAE